MLQTLVGETLTWQCYGGEEDERCGALLTARVEEALYRRSQRGAMIELPACQVCEARVFLKADYSLKELWKATQAVQNEAGVIWAYALPLRYVRNLCLHWLLYDR